jgi:hypothetical protein
MDHPGDPAEDAQQDVQGDLCGAAVFGDDGQWGEKDGFKMGTWPIERRKRLGLNLSFFPPARHRGWHTRNVEQNVS